jgi:addiction module RelB/DinJ family antitoxin
MITTMLIKIDKPLKEKAQKTAKQLGLPLSVIINNYLKTFVQEKQVTFSESYVPNAKTARAIRAAEKDMVLGRNISPSFATAKDAIDYLKAYNKKHGQSS